MIRLHTFSDSSGRFSRSSKGSTVCGIAIPTEKVDLVREGFLSETPASKWATCTEAERHDVALFLTKLRVQSTVCVINVDTDTRRYQDFFVKGDDELSAARAAVAEQDAREAREQRTETGAKPRWPAGRPAGFCSEWARALILASGSYALGHFFKLYGVGLVRDSDGYLPAYATEVLDSDIQDADVIDLMKKSVRELSTNSILMREFGIRRNSEILFANDAEEPLLLVADHVAGAFYSKNAEIMGMYQGHLRDRLFVKDDRFEYEFPTLTPKP